MPSNFSKMSILECPFLSSIPDYARFSSKRFVQWPDTIKEVKKVRITVRTRENEHTDPIQRQKRPSIYKGVRLRLTVVLSTRAQTKFHEGTQCRSAQKPPNERFLPSCAELKILERKE
jgi:hypothetical protein